MTEFCDFLLAEQQLESSAEQVALPFAICDVKSAAGKTYSKALLEKACAEFNAHIQTRPAYGAATKVDRLELPDVSHMVERTWVREGKAWAALRILPTRHGSDLMKILKAGGTVGAAMRASGRWDAEGNVLEMKLLSVDVSLNPTWQGLTASESVFESGNSIDPDEAKMQHRFEMAVRLANYRGTFEEYCRAMRRK